jgi:tetratricopeptide (TPR) repeat protein
MEFNPSTGIVKLCIQGMDAEGRGELEEALLLFLQAWEEGSDDLEKFIAAHYVARQHENVRDKLDWLETALNHALNANDPAVAAAFPPLYYGIAKCYEELGNLENANKSRDLAESFTDEPSDKGPFYHGTRADLQTGEMLTPGGSSNYKQGLTMNHIYFTGLANGAGLAAALANGEGRERVYIVEPAGSFENDPNLTNKKFPGNPTRSYRSPAPLKIIGELTDWVRQTPDQLQTMRERLASSKGEIIN